jgi:hypothetical protein
MVGGGSAKIQLRSGRVYDAERIDVGLDSTRFINSDTDSLMVLPTRTIKSFRVTHRGGGGLEGLLFGSLGGLSVGFFGVGPEGGMAGIYGMFIGGIGGGVIGGIKGHNYTFLFPADSVSVDPKTPSILDLPVKGEINK